MIHDQSQSRGWFDVTAAEVKELFSIKNNPEGAAKALLVFVGLLLTPITLLGALWFYMRGYSRFMGPNKELPRLSKLRPIVKLGMVIGSMLTWVIGYFTAKLMVFILLYIGGKSMRHQSYLTPILFIVNIVFTYVLFFLFNKWRNGITKFLTESRRYGSARFINLKELLGYRVRKGFYIGTDLFYKKAGHLLSVAGTRAGKMVNLLSYNLLMPHLFRGSWVIVDPKGELAAISARVQRWFGRKVVFLNPWDLLGLGNTVYNPLDILKSDRINLSDDVQMIAEAIVPISVEKEQDHFDDRARAYISGLLLHLVTGTPKEDRHLGTLWQWLRLDQGKWLELLAEMMLNDDENAGEIVRACANEVIALMKNSDREYGSVISSAQKFTDFIKSPALRDAMQVSDEFTSADLASGKVTVYLCIPFDRLRSHNAWLRLVVTSLMRSVIRNPQKDVCFLLDEAYAFGFHSEILTAMGAYAGFGVHVWSIFQDLSQIKKIYGDNWQTFISNSSVRHFFNISDNFSAEYLEKMFGTTSIPTHNEKGDLTGATARPLITADEIRRESGETIYTVIDQLAPAQIPKIPYYETNLDCDSNPYWKPEGEQDDEFGRTWREENIPPMPPEEPNEEGTIVIS